MIYSDEQIKRALALYDELQSVSVHDGVRHHDGVHDGVRHQNPTNSRKACEMKG